MDPVEPSAEAPTVELRGVGGWLLVYLIFTALVPVGVITAFAIFIAAEGVDEFTKDPPRPGDFVIWGLMTLPPISVFFTGRSWVAYFNRLISTVGAIFGVATLNPLLVPISISWAVYWFRSERVRNTYLGGRT